MNTFHLKNHKLLRLFTHSLSILVILAIGFPVSASVTQPDDLTQAPNILASITFDWFEALDFAPETTIHIQIYDAPAGALLWEGDRVTDTDGFVHIGEWEHPANFIPGVYIVIADGTTTKALELEAVTLDVFDTETDYLSGTAPPTGGGRQVRVATGNESSGCEMYVTADPATGAWEADFANDVVPCDVTGDMWGAAQVFDADGDTTEANPVPDPNFTVFPHREWFDGNNWPEGATVNISVAGKAECATSAESEDFFFNGSFPEGCDLVFGDTVTFTDGITIRTHTIQNLDVTSLDILADTVSGTADTGAEVQVWPQETGEVITVTATTPGVWSVDFSSAYDIVAGEYGRAAIFDAQDNATAEDWGVPSPHFSVFPEVEWLDGLDWQDGANVEISVTGKPECSLVKESIDGFFNGDFPVGCDLEVGDEVAFTDGVTLRTHTVRELAYAVVDIDTDIVQGTAEEGATVYVWAWDTGGETAVVATGGNWEVDFGAQGIDLVEGMGIRAEIRDEMINATTVDYWIPNPHFTVFPKWEWFDGLEWPDGATVDISVAGKPVCATSSVSSGFFFNGGFPEGCNLVIGDVVVFTDGDAVRTHTVQNLNVTAVDVAADTVAGVADPGAVIYVWPHEGPEVQVTADAGGEWLADFSGLFDIVAATEGRSEIRDEAGNATAVDWLVPDPFFRVFPEWEWFDGLEWPDGATVVISVAGKPVCSTSQVSADYFFNGGFPEGCDIGVGDVVTFTDGESVRTHTVRELAVSGVDKSSDTVAGTAAPGELVVVFPHETGEELQITAAASGDWLADFSGVFDIVPGDVGRSEVRDAQGNATTVDWLAYYELHLPQVMNQ